MRPMPPLMISFSSIADGRSVGATGFYSGEKMRNIVSRDAGKSTPNTRPAMVRPERVITMLHKAACMWFVLELCEAAPV